MPTVAAVLAAILVFRKSRRESFISPEMLNGWKPSCKNVMTRLVWLVRSDAL
jgi:hypothetical protein